VISFKIKPMLEIEMFRSSIISLMIGEIKKRLLNNSSKLRSRIISTKTITRISFSKEEAALITMNLDKIIST